MPVDQIVCYDPCFFSFSPSQGEAHGHRRRGRAHPANVSQPAAVGGERFRHPDCESGTVPRETEPALLQDLLPLVVSPHLCKVGLSASLDVEEKTGQASRSPRSRGGSHHM